MKDRLKQIRVTLRYNQQQMADELDCNVRAYRSYEYETRNLPIEVLKALNEKLNVNLNWLFTGKGPTFNPLQTEPFADCDCPEIFDNFKTLHKRYNKILAEKGMTDFDAAELTNIPLSRLHKIGLGKAEISMQEFLKLRSKINFDANWFLLDLSSDNTNNDTEQFSTEEVELIKKLYKKVTS